MKTNKLRIGIIDLKINNIFSIFEKVTQEANFKSKIIEKKEIINYDLIILPGVGSFQ